ncbi:MAG: Gfo/Idh/MocA family oxidoreductase [Chloroflexi bacterium]|nr:Gfo/Idh/MocA family oxidoreductase [Chloroflexota bacterium]
MTEKLRWGLLSTADINQGLFEPLRKSRRNTLLAVASRDLPTAEAYARKHKIKRAHASYADLLADPDIDVVYNPLPNHLHAEWTVKAVKAGKHILCEKPLALSVDEVDAISAAAEKYGRVVVEALMYRSHAQTLKVREIVQGGKLGQVKVVRGSFTYPGTDADNYRLKPEMGGGCLWDVGVYPLSFTRFMLGAEPLEVFGWQTLGATGVDESFAAQLRFPDGVHLQMDCSMALPYHVFMEIVGDEAALVIPQPFNPGLKNALYLTRKGKTETIQVNGAGTYVGEVEAMADAILEGAPPAVPLADSRGTVAAIQALFESARTGKAVSRLP